VLGSPHFMMGDAAKSFRRTYHESASVALEARAPSSLCLLLKPSSDRWSGPGRSSPELTSPAHHGPALRCALQSRPPARWRGGARVRSRPGPAGRVARQSIEPRATSSPRSERALRKHRRRYGRSLRGASSSGRSRWGLPPQPCECR